MGTHSTVWYVVRGPSELSICDGWEGARLGISQARLAVIWKILLLHRPSTFAIFVLSQNMS